MTIVNKYRLWCNDESAWVYQWNESEPTACPNNTSHTLDTDKTSIVAKEGQAGPIREDGTPFVATAPAMPGSPLFPVGIAKTFTLPQQDPVEIPHVLTEDRYLNGAHGEVWGDFTPGEGGDYVEFFVQAPDGQGGWVTVGQFGETLFLGQSGLIGPFISEESTKVPAGCRFVANYHAAGASGTVNLVGWIRTYKEPE